MIEKPKNILNLRQWREDNGLTTPEWEMYINAIQQRSLIENLLYFVLGVLTAAAAMLL